MLWTHYDCEVNVALYATRHECYLDLKGWLDDCSVDDCGHDLETMDTNDEIADALEYHWDEMSYDICEVEVPVAVPQTEVVRPLKETVDNPNRTVTDEQGHSYLEALDQLHQEAR